MEIFLFHRKGNVEAVKFRLHLNFLLLFLDFAIVLHEVPVNSEELGIPLVQMMLAP